MNRSILSDAPSLRQTAVAFLAIRDQFLDDDLREELDAAYREFRKRFPNLNWHLREAGHLKILAHELAALTGDQEADCLAAIKAVVDCDWSTIARREICQYTARLNLRAGRRSA